jgi:mannose-6-phosphate isomerase-like protein (cupin superfamily)
MQFNEPRVLGPDEGDTMNTATLGVRFMIDGDRSGGGFSLVEHPIVPRGLAAPRHRHRNEDEYSFVLEGRMGAELGGEVLEAGVGDLVFKPRGEWHSFWNAGDEQCRVLEIISPAGFEGYFRELGEILASPPPDPERMAQLWGKYELDMDMASVPELVERHRLRFPMPPRD